MRASSQLATPHKGFAAIDTNDGELVIDGVSIGTDTSLSLPVVDRIYNRRRYDGNAASSKNSNAVRFLAFLPRRVSQADMITYTS